MSEVISGMTGPQLIGFVAVVGTFVFLTAVGVTAIVMPYLTSARRAETAAQLKRDLAAAGYSAEDIERIVKATPGDQFTAASC